MAQGCIFQAGDSIKGGIEKPRRAAEPKDSREDNNNDQHGPSGGTKRKVERTFKEKGWFVRLPCGALKEKSGILVSQRKSRLT